MDDVSIESTLDIIERAALLDKIAAIGTEFEREYPSRDQAIRYKLTIALSYIHTY